MTLLGHERFLLVGHDRGDVRGAPIDSGHHMAEEAPAELADALRAFFE